MNHLIVIAFVALVTSSNCQSQEISCNELHDFITEKAVKNTLLNSYILDSSWLHKVTSYTYDYKIYVVAEIKINQYSFNAKSYIFCGIPAQNWQKFRSGSYGDPDSYGKRFHKYIMDYQCNCS